jgi:hypothetical protein
MLDIVVEGNPACTQQQEEKYDKQGGYEENEDRWTKSVGGEN